MTFSPAFIAFMAALSFAVIGFIFIILIEWGFVEIVENAPVWQHKIKVAAARCLKRSRRLMKWLGDEPVINSRDRVTVRTDWRN